MQTIGQFIYEVCWNPNTTVRMLVEADSREEAEMLLRTELNAPPDMSEWTFTEMGRPLFISAHSMEDESFDFTVK
jgi:hypothetical protein